MPGIKKLGHIDVVAFDRETDDWGNLSNYALIPILMETPFGLIEFLTVEHYFQYMKDPNNESYLKQILNCNTAGDARKAGRSCRLNKVAWDNGGSDAAMDAALTAKMQQHPNVVATLMQTENACLIEDTGSRLDPQNQDGHWGWKTGGQITETKTSKGNKLGILWMKKRNEIYAQLGKNALMVNDPQGLSEEARQIMRRDHLHQNLIDLPLHRVPTETAKDRVLGRLYCKGAVNLEVVNNAIKISFNDESAAEEIAKANQATREGCAIIIEGETAKKFFKRLEIEHHGKTNKYRMFDALVYEYQQQKAPSKTSTANLLNGLKLSKEKKPVNTGKKSDARPEDKAKGTTEPKPFTPSSFETEKPSDTPKDSDKPMEQQLQELLVVLTQLNAELKKIVGVLTEIDEALNKTHVHQFRTMSI